MRAEAYVSKSVLNTRGHYGFHGVAAITKLGVGMKGVTGAFGRDFLKVDHCSLIYLSFHTFGFANYDFGSHMGVHIEPGPDGGIVILDDTKILDMALEILEQAKKKKEQPKEEV